MNLFVRNNVTPEGRRNMAINMAGQIHQVAIQKGTLTVEQLLETTRILELYLATGETPARIGNITSISGVRPVA